MISNRTYKSIEDEIFSYRKGPDDIINPVEMAANNRIITAYADFSGYDKLKNMLGYYRIDVVDDTYSHVICCRMDIDPKWLKFVLAHELAHYFVHKNNPQDCPWPEVSTIVDAIAEEPAGDEKEEACDLFAREMLMPERRYRKGVNYYRERGLKEEKTIAGFLASDFNVPFIHAWRRGVDLEVFRDVA